MKCPSCDQECNVDSDIATCQDCGSEFYTSGEAIGKSYDEIPAADLEPMNE